MRQAARAERVLSQAARAVALLQDDGQPALDRCTGYVVCAAAYNRLSLWELVDELYERAQALVPLSASAVQAAALAVNRVLVRLERATSLLETGRDEQGREQLHRAVRAAQESRSVALPSLWRLVATQRWQARSAVLVAARSFLDLERLQADQRRLTLDLTTDVLTGLSNRRAFEHWLAQDPPRDACAAVLLLDLDLFKRINDTHGHGVGDDVLRSVGRLIGLQVRPGDLASRHGGDEFVTTFPQAQPASAPALARALSLRRIVQDHDWSTLAPGLAVDVSIGVAVGALSDGADLLYRRADTALYAAKRTASGVVLAAPAGG